MKFMTLNLCPIPAIKRQRAAALHDASRIRTNLLILVFVLLAGISRAETNTLTSLLQQGLLEEQANGNLDAAIADYRSLALEFDKDRQLAATAVFRLGECYRAQGKTNEAVAQYQRILREFPELDKLATMSRQNLVGLGATVAEAIPAEDAAVKLWNAVKDLPPSRLEKVLPTLVTETGLTEIVHQRDVAADIFASARVEYGNEHPKYRAAQAASDAANKRVADTIDGVLQALKLRAELSQPGVKSAAGASSDDIATDEDREIQRLKQMVQNSPDLINRSNTGELHDTPLCAAARKGQLRVAEFLLGAGADINLKSANTFTPLQSAARYGQNSMVALLLDHGADVDAGGETPLAEVAERGYKTVAETLLAHHANVNMRDSNGRTPLCAAAESGNAAIIELLLAHGADASIKNNQGRTALSWAAARDQNEAVVKALLDAKADPNAGELDLPLLCAIHIKDAASAEMLLQAGANPNKKGKVDWEVREQNVFYQNGAPATPLFEAFATSQPRVVQLLLKFKADPNDSQTDGRPVLFKALWNTNTLEELLDAGAKVDAVETIKLFNDQRDNRTVLDAAVADQNYADAVGILLKHGANPNAQDDRGDTPLHWAALFQLADEKVFRLLLDYKANPNVRDNDGKTPLGLVEQNRGGGAPGGTYTPELFKTVVDLLHQFGALDIMPNWDRIEVNRLSGRNPFTVFLKHTNDWNRFTLLESILNYYEGGDRYRGGGGRYPSQVIFEDQIPGGVAIPKQRGNTMPFPDLTRVVIVRPDRLSTNESRITVNLLDSSNAVDCSKDVPLEFGDMVEISESDHPLGQAWQGLDDNKLSAMINCLHGTAQLVVRGQKADIPLDPFDGRSFIGSVLRLPAAQQLLLSSSDLSHVKITRRDSKTGQQHEWTLDCSNTQSGAPDLYLRDGDIIEVPEKQ